jgi:hypothetical protein
MRVDEGKFILYSRITPPLQAGDYRLTARQTLGATRSTGPIAAADLPVADLPVHFRVRAPRFALPPDQVLSTFPPANAEGDFGARLPQIVIKRRTLPWERFVGPGGRTETPWLALVLIAEGEAELKLNQPIAECVTPGVVLDGIADAEKGNYLLARKSFIDAAFPTRLDVPLLAHARQVDIHDTELMMGDDDGFLAVVIANRLPLPATNPAGEPLPKKYLACLINLEGQFEVLRERAPAPAPFTLIPQVTATAYVNMAGWDQMAMGMSAAASTVTAGAATATVVPHAATRAAAKAGGTTVVGTPSSAAVPFQHTAEWSSANAVERGAADVYTEMAQPFARADLVLGDVITFDPSYRFPVLLHWSFTSVGQTTFRELMEGLDSGLLGTTAAATPDGRPPLEVVETGHVGLGHRTRRGDEVRIWYRGPLVPHPMKDGPADRLPLAHASDQLRIVVPDGREDLSLAAAFEIGRLLTLARPSMVASLLRWRQLHYQAARRQVIWQAQADFLGALDIAAAQIAPDLGVLLGRSLTRAIADCPEEFLGDPRALVDAGRPLPLEGPAAQHLAAGLGVPAAVLRGKPEQILGQLQKRKAPIAPAPAFTLRAGGLAAQGGLGKLGQQELRAKLDHTLARLVAGTVRLAPKGRSARIAPDALDRLLERSAQADEEETE